MVCEKILVVGSGESGVLDVDIFSKVYAANSSFTRLSNLDNLSLVLSEAMFFSEDDLNQHPTVPNMSRESSNAFSMNKYGVIDGLDLERIIVIDYDTVDITAALNKKNVAVEKLTLLDRRSFWSLFFSSFNFFDRLKIFSNIVGLANKLKFILQCVLNRRMLAVIRPSSGVVAIMMAFHENPNAEIYINGINIYDDFGVRPGFYKGGAFEYQHSSHMLDGLYCKLFVKKGLRIHNS